MSKTLESYTTTKGTVFKKVEASDGRVMHFKDGTPVTGESYAGGQASKEYDGEPVEIPQPDDSVSGGYRRKEVSADAASVIGRQLQRAKEGQAHVSELEIDGEKINIDDMIPIAGRITDRFGGDAVMRYRS